MTVVSSCLSCFKKLPKSRKVRKYFKLGIVILDKNFTEKLTFYQLQRLHALTFLASHNFVNLKNGERFTPFSNNSKIVKNKRIVGYWHFKACENAKKSPAAYFGLTRLLNTVSRVRKQDIFNSNGLMYNVCPRWKVGWSEWIIGNGERYVWEEKKVPTHHPVLGACLLKPLFLELRSLA